MKFGPYSPIYKAGNFYYISGQVGVDPKNKKAEADIESQTHQTMKNIEQVLASAGLKFPDLVKTTIYLTNIENFSSVNKIYESYFEADRPKPARACLEVSKMPNIADKKLLIEIEAVAYKS